MFHSVEDNAANDHHHQHKAKTIQQVIEIHRPRAQEGIAEGLDDGGHRVGLDHPLKTGWNGGGRVDDRRGVHQQLHAELHQKAQVAVFGGQRGDDDAEAQAESRHHQHQDRRERNPQPVGLDGGAAQDEEKHEDQEHAELDQEGDQVRDQDGNGYR